MPLAISNYFLLHMEIPGFRHIILEGSFQSTVHKRKRSSNFATCMPYNVYTQNDIKKKKTDVNAVNIFYLEKVINLSEVNYSFVKHDQHTKLQK